MEANQQHKPFSSVAFKSRKNQVLNKYYLSWNELINKHAVISEWSLNAQEAHEQLN